MNTEQKIQLLENLTGKKVILKESAVDKPNRPKIKLRAMWQDREERRLEQLQKMLQHLLQQEVIEGNLDLSKEPIENLGNIKHVNGKLYLSYCTNLTSLPAGLTVGGDLILKGCKNLTSLPANLTVKGNLWLQGCKSLISLPAGLTVNGGLNLYDCISLTSLPANLTVNGALILSGCTSLTSLPVDLRVKGNLYLHGCQQQVIDQAIQMFGKNKVFY